MTFRKMQFLFLQLFSCLKLGISFFSFHKLNFILALCWSGLELNWCLLLFQTYFFNKNTKQGSQLQGKSSVCKAPDIPFFCAGTLCVLLVLQLKFGTVRQCQLGWHKWFLTVTDVPEMELLKGQMAPIPFPVVSLLVKMPCSLSGRQESASQMKSISILVSLGDISSFLTPLLTKQLISLPEMCSCFFHDLPQPECRIKASKQEETNAKVQHSHGFCCRGVHGGCEMRTLCVANSIVLLWQMPLAKPNSFSHLAVVLYLELETGLQSKCQWCCFRNDCPEEVCSLGS